MNGKEVRSLVPTEDEGKHGQLRRSVANSFTVSAVAEMEHLIHQTTLALVEILNERRNVDLVQQLLWYSLDSAGQIAFSEDTGFMRSDADVDGGAEMIHGRWSLSTVFDNHSTKTPKNALTTGAGGPPCPAWKASSTATPSPSACPWAAGNPQAWQEEHRPDCRNDLR